METIKKFVVIGPESTGKSSLCSQLARHYNTQWVREYARAYLEMNGMNYSFDDLLTIAKGQIELEESAGSQVSPIPSESFAAAVEGSSSDAQILYPVTTASSQLLFIDTDMYVMKVWCEFVFNRCHNWILNRIAERKYDGYLLCNTDLPWTRDNLREYPEEGPREKLFHFYKDLLANQSTPWVTISGNYDERLAQAISFIERMALA